MSDALRVSTLVDSAPPLCVAVGHATAVLRRWAHHRRLPRPVGPYKFGPCGLRWVITYNSHGEPVILWSVIVTQADIDGAEWLHASIAATTEMPSYDDLKVLKEAMFGFEREAYQVFPPSARHVSIHDRALHLWGLADGGGVLPAFGEDGSI